MAPPRPPPLSKPAAPQRDDRPALRRDDVASITRLPQHRRASVAAEARHRPRRRHAKLSPCTVQRAPEHLEQDQLLSTLGAPPRRSIRRERFERPARTGSKPAREPREPRRRPPATAQPGASERPLTPRILAAKAYPLTCAFDVSAVVYIVFLFIFAGDNDTGYSTGDTARQHC